MTTEPRVQAERRIRSLEDRLARLESMLVTYWCLGVGAVLTAGLVLPYGTEERLDAEPVSWSVLSTPFNTVREGAASDSGPGVEGVLFLVGFTGLLLVVAALLIGLFVIANGRATDRAVTVLRMLLVLAGIGTAVVLLLTLTIMADTHNDGGPGGLVLAAGLIAYAALLSRRARAWWQPQPRT